MHPAVWLGRRSPAGNSFTALATNGPSHALTPQHKLWIGFVHIGLAVPALNPGVTHRKSHTAGMEESLNWAGVWICAGRAVPYGLGKAGRPSLDFARFGGGNFSDVGLKILIFALK